MVKHVVVGLGEIGSAIREVFKADGEDPFKNIFAEDRHYNYLHICIPFSKDFHKEVKRYQAKFTPNYTVIHSTVPIGTSGSLNAHHSPVRGVHPYLVDGILTFKKFIGGPDCFEIANEFKRYRIHSLCVRDARHTEALKLIDTTQYGVLLMMQKEIYKWCEDNKVDFNMVYTLANETYNDGYVKMFRPEVVRPYFKYMKGKLGGHCIIPNAKLLMEYSPIPCAKKLLDDNQKI